MELSIIFLFMSVNDRVFINPPFCIFLVEISFQDMNTIFGNFVQNKFNLFRPEGGWSFL